MNILSLDGQIRVRRTSLRLQPKRVKLYGHLFQSILEIKKSGNIFIFSFMGSLSLKVGKIHSCIYTGAECGAWLCSAVKSTAVKQSRHNRVKRYTGKKSGGYVTIGAVTKVYDLDMHLYNLCTLWKREREEEEKEQRAKCRRREEEEKCIYPCMYMQKWIYV